MSIGANSVEVSATVASARTGATAALGEKGGRKVLPKPRTPVTAGTGGTGGAGGDAGPVKISPVCATVAASLSGTVDAQGGNGGEVARAEVVFPEGSGNGGNGGDGGDGGNGNDITIESDGTQTIGGTLRASGRTTAAPGGPAASGPPRPGREAMVRPAIRAIPAPTVRFT